MNFNQGFGSGQGFAGGYTPQGDQWQTQNQQVNFQGQAQNNLQQWQNSTQGHQQQFGQQAFDMRQGWQGAQQQMHAQNFQANQVPVSFQMAPNQMHPGNLQQQAGGLPSQDAKQMKKQQYEEQQRKLREISNRGIKSKGKDGRNLIDDFMSKTDLNLSSNLKQRSKSATPATSTQGNRQMNVFGGQSHSDIKPPDYSMNINPGFTQNPVQYGVQASQPSQFVQPGKQFQPIEQGVQSLSSSLHQQGFKMAEDDFGDFQGGSTSPIQHQQGSLNSSTSSLTSLKSSSGNVLQRASSIETEQMPPARNDSSLSLQQPGSLQNSASSLGLGFSFSQMQSPRDQNLPNTTAMQGKAQTPRDQSYQAANQFQMASPRDQSSQFSGQLHGQQQVNQGFQVTGQASQAQLHPTFQAENTPQGISPQEPSFQSSGQMQLQAPLEQAFPTSSQGQAPPSEFFTQPVLPMPQTFGAADAPFGNDVNHMQMNLVENPLEELDEKNIEESLYGSKLPSWCHNRDSLPAVYKKIFEKSTAFDGEIETKRVYPLLLASNVSKERLRDIWEMANKKNPGTLIEEELYLLLGLIALAQAGWTKLSISKLVTCNTAPIPEFPEYVFMDTESGSVFGGDSLAVEEFDDRSISPVDPNDRYSIFRSYEKKRTTSVSHPANEPSTSSNEMSSTFKGGLHHGNEAANSNDDLPYGDFKAGGVLESPGGWAEFQSVVSSAAPSFVGFTSEQQHGQVGAVNSLKAPSVPKNSDDDFGSFQTTGANNTALNTASNIARTQSTAVNIGSNIPPPVPVDSTSFSQQHVSVNIVFASFQKSSQTSVPGPIVPQSAVPDFKADFGEFASVPISSQDSVFNVVNPQVSTDVSGFSASSESSSQDDFAEFRSMNINSATGNFGIFPSIDVTANLSQNTPKLKSFGGELSVSDKLKSMIPQTTNDLQSTEVNSSLEEIVNRMDESWDDFTSFAPVPENGNMNSKNPGVLATSRTQSNAISTAKSDPKNDLLSAFETSASSNEDTKFGEVGMLRSSDSKKSEILSAFGTQGFSDNAKEVRKPNIDLSRFSALSVSDQFEPMQKLNAQELMNEDNAKTVQQKGADLPKITPNPMAFDIMPQKETSTVMKFDNYSKADINQDEFADFSSHTSSQTYPSLKDTFNSNSQMPGIFPGPNNAPIATVDDDFADFTSSAVHATDIFQNTSQGKFSEFGQDRGSVRGSSNSTQSIGAGGQEPFGVDHTIGGSKPSTKKTAHFGDFDELEISNDGQLPTGYSAGSSKEVNSGVADNGKELNIKAFADFNSTESIEDFTFGKPVSAADLRSEAIQSQSSSFDDFDAFKSNHQADPVVQLNSSSFSQDRAFIPQPNKAINSADQLGNFAASFNAGRVNEIIPSQQQQQLQQQQQQEFAKPRLASRSSQDNYVEPALEAEDRYKALTGVLEDSDLHLHEWKRCLSGIKTMFESTADVMKRHNLSLQSKKEVFDSEKGKEFFNGLKEIFAVACRIKLSIEKCAVAKSNEELKLLLTQIDTLWRELCGFSSGLPEYAFPTSSNLSKLSREDLSADSQCGICLLSVNNESIELNGWIISMAHLTYGGKLYHSTCANFWCNKVNPVLPALPPLTSGLL